MNVDLDELLQIIGAKEYQIVQLRKQVQHLTDLLAEANGKHQEPENGDSASAGDS